VTVILAILLLLLIVVIHEAGHFIASLIFGLKVNALYIGLPFKWKAKVQLGKYPLYFTPILFGAAVDIEEKELQALPFWKQTVILLAGVFMNTASVFIAAVLLFGPAKGLQVGLVILTLTFASLAALGLGILPAQGVSGPVGIVAFSSGVISGNPIQGTLTLFMVISAALAVTNILPIPGLDGGQVLIRFLVRRGLPQVWADRISGLAILLLLATIAVITVNDVLTIAGKSG
jgi:membrane-associated protease RseP (regulator of RpoE activity)